jgi:hypothetical protein
MVSTEGTDAIFIGQDTRTDFKQIIAKRSDLAKFARGRLVFPATGDQIYYAGQVLGQITAPGPTQYRWTPYNVSNTDGSQIAKAILANTIDVDSNDNGSEVTLLTGGCAVFQSSLIGLDSAAITALGARSYVENGVNILDLS